MPVPSTTAPDRSPCGRWVAQVVRPDEHRVLALVAMGLDDAAVAGVLGIGEATVRERLAACQRKLRATDRVDAVRRHRALRVLDERPVRHLTLVR